jgi:hypothetical protein
LNQKLFQTSNKEFSEKERTITHYISTAGVDEFGEILLPKGMDDSKFKAVLWSHSLGLSLLEDRVPPPSELVIGKSLWRNADENGVLAKTEFANTPLGNDVMRFNAEGYINSWSVGWKPKGAKKVNTETGITIYPKWYLYEYSSVIIPANPDAINLMLKEASSDNIKNILGREHETSILKNDMMRYKDSVEKLIKDIAGVKTELNELQNELSEIKNKMKGSVHTKSHSKEALINEAINKVFEEIVGRKI